MSQLSLSVNFLPTGQSTPSFAGDSGKEPKDGFQALLDIGVDITADDRPQAEQRPIRQRPAPHEKDETVVVTDSRKEVVREERVQPSERKPEVRDTARTDTKEQRPTEQAHRQEPQEAHEHTAVHAETRPGAEPSETEGVATHDQPAIVQPDITAAPTPSPATPEDVIALRDSVFHLLGQLVGQPVTDLESAQRALNVLGQALAGQQTQGQQEDGQAAKGGVAVISRPLFAQLQSLVQGLGLIANAQQTERINPAEFNALLVRVQQATGNDLLPKNADGQISQQSVQQLIQRIKNVTHSFANLQPGARRDNTPAAGTLPKILTASDIQVPQQQAEKPSHQPALARQSAVAVGQEEVVVQNKGAQQANQALAANLQTAGKLEAALGKQGGFESGTQQRDGALPAALVRNPLQAPNASAQSSPAFSKILHQANAKPVIDQIVFQIRTTPATGNSRIHIQLHPAELGKLDIKMQVDGEGKTGITVTADNRNTLDLLQRDRTGLERALADAGLRADSGNLNFNLRGEQQQGQGREFSGPLPYGRIPEEESQPVEDILSGRQAIYLSEGLDIKI